MHLDHESFNQLITLTANYVGIPETAVKRDYYIVMLLQNLQNSIHADNCVFKGGTSLSKCYPGSINRFSEDIDLTYIPQEDLTPKKYKRILKDVELTIIGSAFYEKIDSERNDRNKSSYVWFDEEDKEESRIKLEIGSNIRPDPYQKKSLTTYIHQYLFENDMQHIINEFNLKEVSINTLCIERTFLDKVFSVKRHAICGSLKEKVRHIYDVTRLFPMDIVKEFLSEKNELSDLIKKTKETDSFYLEKRNTSKDYNPLELYSFRKWNENFNSDIRLRYESLHNYLLYTSEKQDFDIAIETFNKISDLFEELGE
ncbi:nucleotidyl transferase AbiEii/AbiGii toxin family protein [Desulfosporosinus nitroreducens]|uniref:Nucleotidyl transferase AbiEii/AbiGii toxin family protein n=1 Tax=Desulfosporosinus nitroreducens TaxID=2018668 RepID=A0ABT8QKU9_9FIRM|nr:nucleotidyl transferase AbiEii/AbiGii toxin family protein [Desulfosporosinus nitroreducens]MDO0821963.1 nucleotidyl transferase AbiEii/AbiGii toxin family protein [Desulfosporosinus nitroreducens]